MPCSCAAHPEHSRVSVGQAHLPDQHGHVLLIAHSLPFGCQVAAYVGLIKALHASGAAPKSLVNDMLSHLVLPQLSTGSAGERAGSYPAQAACQACPLLCADCDSS